MRKVTMIMLSVAVLFAGNCIAPRNIDAGTEGVVIKKPWIFGHGGVSKEPIPTGLSWCAWSTQVEQMNLKPFTISEKFDDLVTSDNLTVDFNVHMQAQQIQGQTPMLIEKFGKYWYQDRVKEPLRSMVREFTKAHKVFEMTTDSRVSKLMEELLFTKLTAFIADEGIPVKLIQVSVGKVIPPDAVLTETIQTGVNRQKIKTQVERVKAENSRRLAEQASARADRAYAQTFGMSSSQYLEMKRLENEKYMLDIMKEKPDAKMVVISGNNAGKAFVPVGQ